MSTPSMSSMFSVFDSIEDAAVSAGLELPSAARIRERTAVPVPKYLGARSIDEIPPDHFKDHILYCWSEYGPKNRESAVISVPVETHRIRCVCKFFEDMRCAWCTYETRDSISVDSIMTDHGTGTSIVQKLSSVIYTVREHDDKYSRHEIESIDKIDSVSSIYIPPDVKEYAKRVFRTIRNFNDQRTILRGNKARALLVACVLYAFMFKGQFCSYDLLCTAFDITKNRKAVTQAFGTVSIIMSFMNEPPLQPLTPQQYISSICVTVSFPFELRDIVMGTRLVYGMLCTNFSGGHLIRTLSTFVTMLMYAMYFAENDSKTHASFKFLGISEPKGVVEHVISFTRHSDTTISSLFKNLARNIKTLVQVGAIVVLDDPDYNEFVSKYGTRGPMISVDTWAPTLHIRKSFLDTVCTLKAKDLRKK